MYLPKLCLLGLVLLFRVVAGIQRSKTKTITLPNLWVVWLKDNADKTAAEHAAWASSLYEENPKGFRGLSHVFDFEYVNMRGYSGEFSDEVMDIIRKDKDVYNAHRDYLFPVPGIPDPPPPTEEEVEERRRIMEEREEENGDLSLRDQYRIWQRPSNTHFRTHRHGPSSTIVSLGNGNLKQKDAPWGLGSISKADPKEYLFHPSAGHGTYIYVLDTGIYLPHEDFEGRAEFGFDATEAGLGRIDELITQNQDHGTHVASSAAGAKYGVAKNARLVDVKVMREPRENDFDIGDASIFVRGIEWAIENILVRRRVGKAVINLSWGGRPDEWNERNDCWELSRAIHKALDWGIPVVMAAGNDNIFAGHTCPANTKKAITVGAIDETNTRAQFGGGSASNWGEDVDIFAPGYEVEAAWSNSKFESVSYNGTSMAAPHVSGVIAYLLSKEGHRTPDGIWKRLEELSQKGKVKDTKGSQNRLLYNGANKK